MNKLINERKNERMNDFEWVSSAILDAKYQFPNFGHAHRKQKLGLKNYTAPGKGGGRGVPGLNFAGYVPLASKSPYPIIAYSVANYRPYLSHFCKYVIFAIPT